MFRHQISAIDLGSVPRFIETYTISRPTYRVIRAFLILRQIRGYKDFHHFPVVKYDQMTGCLMMGWALHYLPFYLMGSQLFLHLWYATLTLAVLCDLVTSRHLRDGAFRSPLSWLWLSGHTPISACWSMGTRGPRTIAVMRVGY
jgi:dolichyl-phosphate-mannose--protein O-mannosyl transferase